MDNILKYLHIPNFALNSFCDQYINKINNQFTNDNLDCDNDWDDNIQRIRIADLEISNYVDSQLNKLYPNTQYYSGPLWFLTKYRAGGGLGIHADGVAYNDGIESTYTILIYLNTCNDRTVFVDSYDDINNLKDAVSPICGDCIILNQTALHYAEELKKGYKYILRGDIFKRI